MNRKSFDYFLGDIKPDNLLFNNHVLKFIDFGLSQSINEESFSNEISGIGTPLYAAPEQLNGEGSSFAADIFSIGMVLFEIISRFSTNMERVVTMTKFRQRDLSQQTSVDSFLVSGIIFLVSLIFCSLTFPWQ